MTTTINASPTNGLVQTADGSGVIKIQSDGKTTNALAWVNFNGTGTVAIRSSYNVSSITDNGTGDYTLNFTTAMSDANYAVAGAGGTAGGGAVAIISTATLTTTTFRFSVYNTSAAAVDRDTVTLAIFGN